MPESDRSAAAQKDLLALYRHFGLAVESDESSVGADIDQNELVAAKFNPRVLAGRFAVRYDDVARALPAERYRLAAGAQNDFLPAVPQAQPRLRLRLRAGRPARPAGPFLSPAP